MSCHDVMLACRGLDNPRLIYEARGVRLQHRNVQHTSDMLMPACGHQSGASVNSSFASSRDSLRRNWSSWVERRGWFSAAGRLTPSPVLNGPSNKLPSPSAAGHGRQGMISADGAVKKQDLSSALAAGGSCTAGRTAGSKDVQARATASARSAAAAAKYAYHDVGSELAAAIEGASPRQVAACLHCLRCLHCATILLFACVTVCAVLGLASIGAKLGHCGTMQEAVD